MGENLYVTGQGTDRAAAIADADKVAAQYFGDLKHVHGTPQSARPAQRAAGGQVVRWEVDMAYESLLDDD